MAETETVELSVPLFKQGDDVSVHLEAAGGSALEALRRYANQLEGATQHVRSVLAHLEGVDDKTLALDAMAHVIALSAPSDVAARLLEAGLALRPPGWDDDGDQEEGAEQHRARD